MSIFGNKGLLAIGFGVLMSFATQASIIISIDEVGDDVVASFSGSINLDALTGCRFNGSSSSGGFFHTQASFQSGPGGSGQLACRHNATPLVLGNIGGFAGYTEGGISVGDQFSYGSDPWSIPIVFFPAGYQSNQLIAGAATFLNETFASMGINSGVYVASFNTNLAQDNVTFNIGQTIQASSPTSVAILGLGFIGLGFLRKNKSLKTQGI